MKSSFELAMERLEKSSGPSRKLSEEQKEQMAEIDRKYEAKAAEVRLSFDERQGNAASHEELAAVRAEFASEMQRIEEQKEAEKNSIWTQE